MILSNISMPPGCSYLVNGKWYQFHTVGYTKNSLRVAQVVVETPSMQPKTIRYVEIMFV